MELLSHLFRTNEAVAKGIDLDDESILKSWTKYSKTIPRKKELIEALRLDSKLQSNLQELRSILAYELVSVHDEEIEEKELIHDLERIEHSQKIKRVHRLEQCLGYAETKYEHVYELLRQLYSVLKSQIHLTEKLLTGVKNPERLIAHLKSQLELELEIIKQIERIETFHNLFSTLVKGEHIIREMDSKEKKLLNKMQKGMTKIFSKEINEGITYQWAITVFNAIEDKVHEGVAKGIFPGYHPDIDFEFANRPEFVDLVRETIQNLKKRKVSEQMINVFVHIFREWYNHERD